MQTKKLMIAVVLLLFSAVATYVNFYGATFRSVTDQVNRSRRGAVQPETSDENAARIQESWIEKPNEWANRLDELRPHLVFDQSSPISFRLRMRMDTWRMDAEAVNDEDLSAIVVPASKLITPIIRASRGGDRETFDELLEQFDEHCEELRRLMEARKNDEG